VSLLSALRLCTQCRRQRLCDLICMGLCDLPLAVQVVSLHLFMAVLAELVLT
jgi:hypothetical protein